MNLLPKFTVSFDQSYKLVLLSIISYFIYVYILNPTLHFAYKVIHYHGFPTYPKLFLLGHLKEVWSNFPYPYNGESMQVNFYESFNKLAAHNPDQSVQVYWATIIPIIFVTDHEGVEIVMNKRNLHRTYLHQFLGLGSGLISSAPAIWKVRRKLIEPFFSTKKIASYAKHMDKEVKSFCDQLDEEVGKPVDLEHQIHESTLNIILKTCISIPMDAFIEDKKKVIELVNKVETNGLRRAVYPLYHNDWLFKFFEFGKYYFHYLATIEKFIHILLDRRKQLLSSSSNEPENHDLIHLLDGKVDKQGQYDELLTLIGAGHETTAVALRWILFNLGNHLDIQERLFQEIIEIFPDDTPVDDLNKINQCAYLDQCIKESLRLYPPAHGLMRYLEEDIMVKDKKLLKSTVTFVQIKTIHHDPSIYPDPDKFDPDRWSPEKASKIPNSAFIPFGYGPRICIGYRYAMTELKIYTIQIIRKFSLKSTRKQDSIPFRYQVSLKSFLPLEIIMTPRNNNSSM